MIHANLPSPIVSRYIILDSLVRADDDDDDGNDGGGDVVATFADDRQHAAAIFHRLRRP